MFRGLCGVSRLNLANICIVIEFGVGVLLIWGQEIETLLGITDIEPSLC